MTKYASKTAYYTILCCLLIIKSNVVSSDVRPLNDRSVGVSSRNVRIVLNIAKRFGCMLDAKQRGLLRLRNGIAAINSYVWMGIFFEICGDHQPNKDEEIHLDPSHVCVGFY
jgi:hypothetical protein